MIPSDRTLPSDDLATSIDATLRAEARRNELAIAWVRALALLGLSGTEAWYWIEGTGVPWTYRIPTFVYAALAVVVLGLLRRGWYPSGVGIAAPALDAAFIWIRSETTFRYHPLDALEGSMELATVGIGASLLITSGGFRLSRTSLVTSTVAGLALYLWFAAQTRVEIAQMVVHVVLLAGVAAATTMLTRQVRRAVRSEVARVTLARFLPPTLLDSVHHDPIALVTRPRSVAATVLVSDIRGFTEWAEARDPIDVLAALNVVQGRLAAIVREHHGMVDKFMGDGMLAVFGTPDTRPDHANLAVQAAIAMEQAVGELHPKFRIGVGVHTGALVVGCLGSGVRMEFTVLGDTVNTASRLEGLTKERSVAVLISGDTVAARGHQTDLTPLGEVQLRGRVESMEIFSPIPRSPPESRAPGSPPFG